MQFLNITKLSSGQYLSRYDIRYLLNDGQEKTYEIVSRRSNLSTQEQLHNHNADAVIMILHNADKNCILLNREFRMATGEHVFSFPAGLMEEGESIEQAARRELKEETGLDLASISHMLPDSYVAIGLGNEKNVCLFGTASGSFAASHSAEEEIESNWYSKAQVRKMLACEPFEARTQLFCHLWSTQE